MNDSVIIVGAGIIGAACARTLASAGWDVTVVDRGTTAGGTSSACEGNLLVSDKGPGHELLLAQYASTLWTDTVAQLGDHLGGEFPSVEYDPKGGLVVATTAVGAAALRAFASRQREAGVDARELTDVEARELEPDLAPGIELAVFYPEDSQVQPTIATEALMASARRFGARLLENTPVTGAVHDSAGALVGIRTPAGELRAEPRSDSSRPVVGRGRGPSRRASAGAAAPGRTARNDTHAPSHLPQGLRRRLCRRRRIG